MYITENVSVWGSISSIKREKGIPYLKYNAYCRELVSFKQLFQPSKEALAQSNYSLYSGRGHCTSLKDLISSEPYLNAGIAAQVQDLIY